MDCRVREGTGRPIRMKTGAGMKATIEFCVV